MTWKVVYTRQAGKDARNLASAGLKAKTERLLAILGRHVPAGRVRVLRREGVADERHGQVGCESIHSSI